jgi:hypothetical protein
MKLRWRNFTEAMAELWETPKLIVLCELVSTSPSWSVVSSAAYAKFKHIPSSVQVDWGKSFTPDDCSEEQCKRMFKFVLSKYTMTSGQMQAAAAFDNPPAVAQMASEIASRLRDIRIKQIQEILKTLSAETSRKAPVGVPGQAPTVKKEKKNRNTVSTQSTPKQSPGSLPSSAHQSPAVMHPLPPSVAAVSAASSGSSIPLPMPMSILPLSGAPAALPDSVSILPPFSRGS